MAELGSTGGNLDNILQYLLQRIEKSGIAEGGTGGGGTTNLDNYYTKAEVNNLITGYATETWVKAQGYLTSANLTGYATEKWVENKGYLTSNDLAEYAKTTDIQKDYVNKTAFETFKSGYDNLAAAVKDANDYTDGKIAALNISQYAKVATLEQVVADVNVAFDAVNNKFADYALLAGFNTFTGTNRFDSRIYLSNALLDNVSTPVGAYFVVEGNNNTYIYRHTNYAYGSTYMTLRSDGKVFIDGGINEYIDIFGGTPHLDFHFNNTTDFTSRIRESASGVLELFSSSYNPGTLKIGNAYITYDSKNNALMVSDGSGGAVNIVAMGDVAAFGGLGSGFDTLTDLTLTNKLTAKSASITEALTAGGINVTGAKEGYINLARGNIEDCYQIKGDEIYANDFFYLDSNKISHISASGNETSGYVVKITIDGKTYAIDATMLT